VKWNATTRAVLAQLESLKTLHPDGLTYEQLETTTKASRRSLQRAVRALAKARRVKAPSRSRGEPWKTARVQLAKR
jgi:hypothetical protein